MEEEQKVKNKTIKKPKGGADPNDQLRLKISQIDESFLKNASKEFIEKMFTDNKTMLPRDQFIKKL